MSETSEQISKIKAYWDAQAKRHADNLAATNPDPLAKELELDALKRALNPRLKTLEAGCGNGYNLFELAGWFEAELAGFDYSASMIRAACKRQTSRKEFAGIAFRVASVLDDLTPLGEFEQVFTDRCLINLPTLDLQIEAVRNLTAILKPGGRLVLVESTRQDYHRDATLNSVHRSSLTVPEIAGAEAEISFVNHFLLKRGYANVGCRITAIDADGQRILSRLHPVSEPRVYTFPLTGMAPERAAGYLVEFFTAENLFVPFPAVMVNHHGPNFLNTVHAYNRVLNDVFEDEAINAEQVAEASVDAWLDEETDTFLTFTSGPQPCRGDLRVELACGGETHEATVALDQPRLTNRDISLSALFPRAPRRTAGILKIHQPRQLLFYGRMLAGLRRADGAFCANHSYYDSSTASEYWDDARPSSRTYPFFPGLDNVVRMYPIMSPGRLAAALRLHGADGAALHEARIGEIASPGRRFLEASANDVAAEAGLDPSAVASFSLIAEPCEGRTPTRVNHQLVHRQGGLASSVNVSLFNPNVFVPEGKAGLAWGQAPVGGEIEAWLGFAAGDPGNGTVDLEVDFYDGSGKLMTRRWSFPGNGALHLRPAELLGENADGAAGEKTRYVWYVARADHPRLSAYTVTRHRASGHCSGEHNF